jgi:four helix bundle protein
MYQAAEALAREVERLLPHAKSRRPKIADHLDRSTDSVLFNMSEGIGSFRPRAKIAAYEISRKEASEVQSALRRLVIANVFTDREIQKAYGLAGSVVGMLTNAIISVEKRITD